MSARPACCTEYHTLTVCVLSQRITEGELLGNVSTATPSTSSSDAVTSSTQLEMTASSDIPAEQIQMSPALEAGLELAPGTMIQRRMSGIPPGPFAERLAALASALEGAN